MDVETQQGTGPGALEGALAEVSVSGLLLQHYERGSTGVLTLIRGKVKQEIFFHDGVPIGALSNIRQQALGSLLKARGVLDDKQLEYLLAETAKRGKRMGEVLVDLGWMTPEEVLGFLKAQSRKRVVDALRWREGGFSFVERNDFLQWMIEQPLDAAHLVLWGLRVSTTPQILQTEFVDPNAARRLIVNPRFERYRSTFCEVFGEEIMEALLAEPAIGDLTMRLDADASVSAAEALVRAGLAAFDDTAAHAEVSVAQDDIAVPDSALTQVALEDLARTAASERDAVDFLVGLSGEIEAVAVDGQADGDGVPNRFLMGPASGAITVGDLDKLRISQSATQSATPTACETVLNEYLRVFGRNAFDVLGLHTDATTEDVQNAYEGALAALPVPENEQLGDTDRDRLNTVQNTIEHAYFTLTDQSLREVEQARLQRRPVDDPLGAEMAFRRGRHAMEQGDLDEAEARLQEAVEKAPEVADFQTVLALLIFEQSGLAQSERCLQLLNTAIELDPGCVDAIELMARIADEKGDLETAGQGYEQALMQDPARLSAFERLQALHTQTGEFHATVAVCQRALRALGRRGLMVRRALWKRLAAIYETEFEDMASARVAYEVAARLDPENPALQRKVITLNQDEPARWREIAAAMTAQWRANPSETQMGMALSGLYRRVKRVAAADNVDLVLSWRQSGGVLGATIAPAVEAGEEEAVAARARTDTPPLVISRPLPAAVIKDLRHPDEDESLLSLFSLLARQGILGPLQEAPPDARLLGPGGQELMLFASALSHVCRMMGVNRPQRILLGDNPHWGMSLVGLLGQDLLIDEVFFATADRARHLFALGRAMSFSDPGRLVVMGRSGRHLRPYVLAAISSSMKTMQSDDGEVRAIEQKISALSGPARDKVVSLGKAFARRSEVHNVSVWGQGVARSADRLGLLMSGDLDASARLVAHQAGPAAVDTLFDFAVSPSFLMGTDAMAGISPRSAAVLPPPPPPAAPQVKKEA